MNFPLASREADELLGPRDSGAYAGTASSVTTSAANITSASVPKGGAYFSFQARGGDVYIRFKATATTAATTSGNGSNGCLIPNGTTMHFFVGPDAPIFDCIASASCTLFWWQSSRNIGNT